MMMMMMIPNSLQACVVLLIDTSILCFGHDLARVNSDSPGCLYQLALAVLLIIVQHL
jgi:hypothetical protein